MREDAERLGDELGHDDANRADKEINKEPIYKEYNTPTGKVQFTKEDFNQVVQLYRWLLEQDQKITVMP